MEKCRSYFRKFVMPMWKFPFLIVKYWKNLEIWSHWPCTEVSGLSSVTFTFNVRKIVFIISFWRRQQHHLPLSIYFLKWPSRRLGKKPSQKCQTWTEKCCQIRQIIFWSQSIATFEIFFGVVSQNLKSNHFFEKNGPIPASFVYVCPFLITISMIQIEKA